MASQKTRSVPTERRAARHRPDPWDRRPDETTPAWEAFVTYRDMGLTRSTAKAARELGKSKTLLDGWSSKHSWVLRVAAYDADQDRQRRLALREAQVKAASRNVEIADALKRVATASLVKIGQADTGVSAQELARFLEVASKLEQSVFGTQVTVHQGTGGSVGARDASGAQVDTDALTDEDRQMRMQMLVREAQARMGESSDEDDDEDGES